MKLYADIEQKQQTANASSFKYIEHNNLAIARELLKKST